jgi:DNA polymerase
MPEYTPDARITLSQLEAEWSSCERCALSVHRKMTGASVVFGEGTTGGVMFIGDFPGEAESEKGQLMVNDSGKLLLSLIENLRIDNYYVTNTVLCRSCEMVMEEDGITPKQYWRQQQYRDREPIGPHIAACRPRLIQEIYSVDPLLIVPLGGVAAHAVLGHAIPITTANGTLTHTTIPGAGFQPQLTPKGKWARKIGAKDSRQLVWPIEQNKVT